MRCANSSKHPQFTIRIVIIYRAHNHQRKYFLCARALYFQILQKKNMYIIGNVEKAFFSLASLLSQTETDVIQQTILSWFITAILLMVSRFDRLLQRAYDDYKNPLLSLTWSGTCMCVCVPPTYVYVWWNDASYISLLIYALKYFLRSSSTQNYCVIAHKCNFNAKKKCKHFSFYICCCCCCTTQNAVETTL